jgi:hypothetical protein
MGEIKEQVKTFNNIIMNKKPLLLDEKNAKEMFKTAPKEIRQMLIDTWGASHFSENIMDRVKSYEDACKIEGIEPLSLAHFSFMHEKYRLSAFTRHQAEVIAAALNEGWQPDWNNTNQYKYFPWFKMSGFGFSGDGCDCTCSNAGVGSRLCFKSSELAVYAGKQFESIYKGFMTF